MTGNGMIEPFRGDIPFCHSRNLLSGIQTLLKPWTPARKSPGWRTRDDRTVQEWWTRRTTLCGRAREEYV